MQVDYDAISRFHGGRVCSWWRARRARVRRGEDALKLPANKHHLMIQAFSYCCDELRFERRPIRKLKA